MAEEGAAGQEAPDAASAASMIEAWDQANPGLAAGAEAFRDIVVAGRIPGLAAVSDIWGEGIPDDLPVWLDGAKLATAIRRNDYLVGLADASTTDWSEGLAGCRALIIPDGAVVTTNDAQRVRRFVRQGGALIAFGHASLRDAAEERQRDYLLADVFAVRYRGHVDFGAEADPVEVTGDSIWAPQYPPENVIDGAAETFWASVEGGPMPHWVQIAFARPRTVARAEVQCRPGFLLQDFEVQCQVGGEWTTCAQVTGNQDGSVDCPFSRPVETQAVRLFVTRESHQDQDRQIADVGEVTLYDASGGRLVAPPYLIEAQITDKAWAKAHRSDRLVTRSPAVRVESATGGINLFVYPELPNPTSEVLAWFADPLAPKKRVPLCTRSKVGKGTAYLFTVPEGGLGEEPEAWEAVLRTFVGMPAVRHSGDEQVVALLRKTRAGHLLNLVDTAPPDTPDRAKEVIVRVNVSAVGPVRSVLVVPGEQPLDVRRDEGWLQFAAPMDPVAGVLLGAGR